MDFQINNAVFRHRKGNSGEMLVQLCTAMGPSQEFNVDSLVEEMDCEQLTHLMDVILLQVRPVKQNPLAMPSWDTISAKYGRIEVLTSRTMPPNAVAMLDPTDLDSFMLVTLDKKTQVSAWPADECPCGGSHEPVEMIFTKYCKKCDSTLT